MSLLVSVGTRGIRLLGQRMDKDLRIYHKEIRVKLREAAFILRKEAKRQYKSHPGITERTGTLHKGIRARVGFSKIDGELEALVGPKPGRDDAFYGKFIELGIPFERKTLGKGKMDKIVGAGRGVLKARPFLRPALEAKLDEVEKIIGEALSVFQTNFSGRGRKYGPGGAGGGSPKDQYS